MFHFTPAQLVATGLGTYGADLCKSRQFEAVVVLVWQSLPIGKRLKQKYEPLYKIREMILGKDLKLNARCRISGGINAVISGKIEMRAEKIRT